MKGRKRAPASVPPPSPSSPPSLIFTPSSPRAHMRALVKESPGPGIVLREVPVPACGPNDALIKVHYAGVCGTDLHIWEWDSWASGRLRPPVIVGHEFAGQITELSREAARAALLAVGDLVTA